MLVGQYIVQRLAQLGVKHIFGLPGDYNMQFLDMIEDEHKLKWVGCANELNASYAVDGYARSTGLPGALVTTFGVGELSALNGIAGAYTEKLPVIHIVGMPTSSSQAHHVWMHHTLGGNKYKAYFEMSQNITCDGDIIGWTQRDLDNAPYIVDRLLVSMLREKLPVYLGVPLDVFEMEVSDANLSTPIQVPRPEVSDEKRDYTVQQIMRHVEGASCPMVLIDGCVSRHGVTKLSYDFVKSTGFPVVVAPMGKSLFPEDDPQYLGEYAGHGSFKELMDAMDKVDLLITLGSFDSDMNTGKFTYRTPMCHTIAIHSRCCVVGYGEFSGIGFEDVLPALSEQLKGERDQRLSLTKELKSSVEHRVELPDATFVSQDYLWTRLSSFLRPDDHIVADMGTSCFGSVHTTLPEGAHYYQQILYGSIGWSVGSTLGVLCGAEAKGKGRVILFVGDGSLMLTMQEISTMMKYGLKPIIFVLNNDGYEVERKIHGPDRSYNNIPPLDYSLLLDFMYCSKDVRAPMKAVESKEVRDEAQHSHRNDMESFKKYYHKVETRKDLDALFNDSSFQNVDGIHLVELFLRRGDAPDMLVKFTHEKLP